MFYAEWLRLRNCLRILGIVLGAIFLLVVLVRLFMPTHLDESQWVQNQTNESGGRRSIVHLKDGTTRTTIIDSQGDRIVILDRGWHGKQVTVSGPGVNVNDRAHVRIGSVGIQTQVSKSGSGVVQIGTDMPIPLTALLAAPCLIGLIIATILGGVLAKENRNHLEVVWTKPVDRSQLALGMFGVDIIGIVAAMVVTFVLEMAAVALFEMPLIQADVPAVGATFAAIFGVIAFYALCNAASASLRGAGGIKALVWLAAIIVPSFIAAALVPVLIFQIVGNIAGVLSVLDPIAYFTHPVSDNTPVQVLGTAVFTSPEGVRAAILLGLALIYSALSLVQWRRLEA